MAASCSFLAFRNADKELPLLFALDAELLNFSSSVEGSKVVMFGGHVRETDNSVAALKESRASGFAEGVSNEVLKFAHVGSGGKTCGYGGFRSKGGKVNGPRSPLL